MPHVCPHTDLPLNFPHISETLITLGDTQNHDNDEGDHRLPDEDDDEDNDGRRRRMMIEGGLSARRV